MIKKLLTGAILLASAAAFAQPMGHHHHHGGPGGYMLKYNMSKVKYYDGASKERLKCHDHGRLFSTEHHGWRKDVGVCQYSRHSNRASWIVVTDGGSHGSLGRDCTLDSSYGWECRRWDRIRGVEFSTSQEERIYERDIRAKVAR